MAQAVETESQPAPTNPSRGAFLEKLGLYTGAVLMGGSIGSETVSRSGVSLQVDNEIPPIMQLKSDSSLEASAKRLKTLETRTPIQEEILAEANNILSFHRDNEIRRAKRATELQAKEDASLILGISRRSWREGFFKSGAVIAAAALLSKSRLPDGIVAEAKSLTGK